MNQRTRQVPVLMYHKIGAPVEGRNGTLLNVATSDFVRQISSLSRLGYRGITLRDAILGWSGALALPARPVVVSFDDAYLNVFQNAAPALRSLGWPATVYVPTAAVGRSNEWCCETDYPRDPIMGWDHLRSLQDEGWEIGGHTRVHPRLDRLEPDAAREEITGSMADIASWVGHAPRTFCYPFGAHNPHTPCLVREGGYIGACTTVSGIASDRCDPYRLPRVKIATRDRVLGMCYRVWIRPRLPRRKRTPALGDHPL